MCTHSRCRNFAHLLWLSMFVLMLTTHAQGVPGVVQDRADRLHKLYANNSCESINFLVSLQGFLPKPEYRSEGECTTADEKSTVKKGNKGHLQPPAGMTSSKGKASTSSVILRSSTLTPQTLGSSSGDVDEASAPRVGGTGGGSQGRKTDRNRSQSSLVNRSAR